ncbi:hypothetical protein [Rhizobium sp. C4]|uniref:hypothetical protein n=1 Tax=Rhizobium sp. C4 TaxID=1349800 RepID=UPI001E5CA6CC|nr:hypothetical protein [Rhizobium sp. C4]MCD2173558.1 hypothetical protein [Rhizobium sp. C4]
MSDSHINHRRKQENPDVINAPVGSETDVTSVALDITSPDINAIAMGGEPFGDRQQRLIELIEEIEARMDASSRGQDLEPLLQEARTALRIVEEREREER